MDVKIGVAESSREIVVASGQTPDEIDALVREALNDPKGLLALTDDKGKRFLMPASRIAYVEIAPEDSRRVGFAVGQ